MNTVANNHYFSLTDLLFFFFKWCFLYNLTPIFQGTYNETPKRLTNDRIYFGSPCFYIIFVLLPHRKVNQLNQIVSIGSSIPRPIFFTFKANYDRIYNMTRVFITIIIPGCQRLPLGHVSLIINVFCYHLPITDNYVH